MNIRIIVLIALAVVVFSISAGAEINKTQGGGNGTYPPEWIETPTPVVIVTATPEPTPWMVPTPAEEESACEVVSGVRIRGEVVDAATQIAPFIWTGQNFAGLYYDVDRNLMSDSLTSTVTIPDTIESGDLEYSTYRVESCYKNPEIGEYFAIGWFGERYMAVNGKPHLISPIIFEMDEGCKKTLATGDEWDLGNGYSLVVTLIDLDANEVWLSLFKNGAKVASSVIHPRETGDWFSNYMHINGVPGAYDVVMWNAPTTSTFVYQEDMGAEADVPIFSVYVDAIFRGTDANIAQFKHAMLIDNKLINVIETGAGTMEAETVTPESVRLVNNKRINLYMDSDTRIAEDLRIHVADDRDGNQVSNYRYYPYIRYVCPALDPKPTPTPYYADGPSEIQIRGEVVEADEIGRLSAVGKYSYQSEYTWNPYNFAALWYDVDGDLSSERLIINTTLGGPDNRIIDEGQLIYTTSPQRQDYGYYKDGGEALGTVSGNNVTSYSIEGWMAEEYVAIGTGGSAAANANKLAKLLVEFETSSDKRTLATEEAWDLGGGFTLTANKVDLQRELVWLSLAKNGKEMDNVVINTSQNGDGRYLYTEDLSSDVSDVIIFFCYVDAVFRGTESHLVQVKHVFLIDNDVENVEPGTSYGNMEVRTASADRVVLANDDHIDLSKNAEVEIMKDMYFRVADTDTVRFYPYKLYTDPGDYDIRGTVVEACGGGNIKEVGADGCPVVTGYTWDPYNFAAFWYDPDNDLKSERLRIDARLTGWDNRTIPEDQLIYTTMPQRQEYQYTTDHNGASLGTVDYNPVTDYYLEGWMAEEYVAISTGGSTNRNANKIAKLLIEFESGSDKQTLATGEAWYLGGGFTLTAKQIDLLGNKVWLSLEKNGKEIDSSVIDANTDSRYMYTEDLSGVRDVVVFFCNVDAVFRGTGSNIVQVKYVFLIDNDVEKIETGRSYGNMEVKTASGDEIILKNDGDIDLIRNTDAEIMKDMYFKVADDNTVVRFYPYKVVTIEGAGEPEEESILDTDGDGVPDLKDKEPDTPRGYWVNSDGIGRMWGDMNGDGKLTSADALILLQAAAGKIGL